MQTNDLTAARRRYKFLRRERDALTSRGENDAMIDSEIEKLEATFPEFMQNDKRNIATTQKSITNTSPSVQTIDTAWSTTTESNELASVMLNSKTEVVTCNEKVSLHSMQKLEHEEQPESELLVHSEIIKPENEEQFSCQTNTCNEQATVSTADNNKNNNNDNEVKTLKATISEHNEAVSENLPPSYTRKTDSNEKNTTNNVCHSDRNVDCFSNANIVNNNNKSRFHSKNKTWMRGRYHDLNASQGANLCQIYSSNAVSITVFSLKVYNEMQKPSVFTRLCFCVLVLQTLLIALLHRYVISPSHPPGSYCLPSLFCLLTHITLLLWIRNTRSRCLSLPMMVVYIFLDILPSLVFVLVIYVAFMNLLNMTNNGL